MNTKFEHISVSKSVFRAYDIRGVINDDFDVNHFYSIAKAISCRLYALNKSDIFLGRDGRLTSDRLAAALRQGFIDSGINVHDLGLIPTPLMYFATATSSVDCGVMVTGSHNPSEYNGIKMVLAGTTLANEEIEKLYIINQCRQAMSGEGKITEIDLFPRYLQEIISRVSIKRPLKIVVDCGNGIAGPVAVPVLTQLGCEVIPLFCDVDGRFPNHHPDPTVESNLIALKGLIKENKADLGLAFDGDGDRLGVVTNQGELIWPDRLMMLYSQHVLKEEPGATIVFDIKCSKHLASVIAAAGGVPKICPTGHSLVKGFMKREGAALAGEMSGHLFFKNRWYGFDDALYSACRLLEILSQSPETADEQFKKIPNSLNTPEIKIPLADEQKFAFMQRFLQEADFPKAHKITLDGLRVEFSDGWGLVRASNTTPCLVARFEAENEQALKDIQALFRQQLLKIGSKLEIPF
jgi:phosphomannomutase/phosphoglucomutase